MALHGAIVANADTLWNWQARRREFAGDPTGNTYQVYLSKPGGDRVYQTILTHLMSDGSLELTRKVMEWAVEVTKG